MQTEIEKADAMKVDQALNHLNERDIPAAEALLRDVCSRCPDEYVYEYTRKESRYIKFWSVMEFTEYVAKGEADNAQQTVIWILSAYPRACFYLAYVLVDKHDLVGALKWLNRGKIMEPQNPNFLLEMGVVHAHMKESQRSFECYEKTLNMKNLSNDKQAIALRGMGVQLIDLQQWDEAESYLNASMEIEPENEIAKRELLYLAQVRSKRGSKKKKSWLSFWK
ncbi:MAG: hypothetical protein HOD43_12825 [Candidatus Marinimicrobia bacterium]|nr:hypothetical protein [Candidatus Neomarinimicrobiota bacterium]MBT4993937.1 hypothetical protein [Candidatus Neomarinimicrobiota bacterium]MBT6051660.1 hypothetical protein [Candidatus Scalindua sp.]